MQDRMILRIVRIDDKIDDVKIMSYGSKEGFLLPFLTIPKEVDRTSFSVTNVSFVTGLVMDSI